MSTIMANFQTIRGGKYIGILIVLLLGISEVSAAAEVTNIHKIKLPSAAFIELPVPKSWVENVTMPDGPFPITINYTKPSDAHFLFSVIPILPDKNEKKKANVTDEKIRRGVQDYADQLKSQVIESDIQLVKLKGRYVSGYFYRVTSRQPIEGKFRYLTQGIVQVGDLPVSFNIFSNDGQKKLEAAALDVVRSSAFTAK